MWLDNSDEYIRPVEVRKMLGISNTTLYNYLNNPDMEFPKPCRLNKRTIRWLKSKIVDYMDKKSCDKDRTK